MQYSICRVMAPKVKMHVEYTDIKVESLKINGISSEKMVLLEDYVVKTMPDVLELQETKVNVDNLPPSMDIEEYDYAVNERTSDQKPGGGLVIYWKDSLPGRIWTNPKMHKNSKAQTEVQWLLLETGTSRLAVANIYLACVSSKNKNYLEWNTEIYNQLQEDITVLRDLCFGIIMMGDYNARIGKYAGMEENHAQINDNRKLLLNFVSQNEFYIMNKLNEDKNCFTRKLNRKDGTNITKSCLDYFLISNKSRTGKWKFSIHDLCEENGISTDHSLIRITRSVLATKTVKKKKANKQASI